jgi:hypothetical protein
MDGTVRVNRYGTPVAVLLLLRLVRVRLNTIHYFCHTAPRVSAISMEHKQECLAVKSPLINMPNYHI